MTRAWIVVVLGLGCHPPTPVVRPPRATPPASPQKSVAGGLPLEPGRPVLAGREATGPFPSLAAFCGQVAASCSTGACGCRVGEHTSSVAEPFVAASTVTLDADLTGHVGVHLAVRTGRGWWVAVDSEPAYDTASADSSSLREVDLTSAQVVPAAGTETWLLATFAVHSAWGVTGSAVNESRRHDHQVCAVRGEQVHCTAPFDDAPGGYDL